MNVVEKIEMDIRFDALCEKARQDYQERLKNRRLEFNCTREDGLCKVVEYEEGFILLRVQFVDDSSITVNENGDIGRYSIVEHSGVSEFPMMDKWYDNDGEAWIINKLHEMPRGKKLFGNPSVI